MAPLADSTAFELGDALDRHTEALEATQAEVRDVRRALEDVALALEAAHIRKVLEAPVESDLARRLRTRLYALNERLAVPRMGRWP